MIWFARLFGRTPSLATGFDGIFATRLARLEQDAAVPWPRPLCLFRRSR